MDLTETLLASPERRCGQKAEVDHSSAEAWKNVQKAARPVWSDFDKPFHGASQEF